MRRARTLAAGPPVRSEHSPSVKRNRNGVVDKYRGTSRIRNSIPPQDHHRALGILLRRAETHTCIYKYIYLCIYAYKYIYLCIYIYIYISFYLSIYLYIYVYIYTYIDMYIYIHIYTYIYIYIYMHIHISAGGRSSPRPSPAWGRRGTHRHTYTYNMIYIWHRVLPTTLEYRMDLTPPAI